LGLSCSKVLRENIFTKGFKQTCGRRRSFGTFDWEKPTLLGPLNWGHFFGAREGRFSKLGASPYSPCLGAQTEKRFDVLAGDPQQIGGANICAKGGKRPYKAGFLPTPPLRPTFWATSLGEWPPIFQRRPIWLGLLSFFSPFPAI